MNKIFQNLMRVARRLTRAGRLRDATRAIPRAVSGASAVEPRATNVDAGAQPRDAVEPKVLAPTPNLVDHTSLVATVEIDAATNAGVPTAFVDAAPIAGVSSPPNAIPLGAPVEEEAVAKLGEGEFVSGSYQHVSQNHSYKLYLPPGHTGRQLPLVVMLHGCSQDPDDFAAGTGMNDVAREENFFVLYPAQSRRANLSGCWNWFKHNDQQRDGGEPAMIAALTHAVMEQHDIDPRRVFIAGLSAGGAMAAIVAEAYPEIFAAVGVHSGLRRGAASSAFEAFTVMRNGGIRRGGVERAGGAGQANPVPTIVFHGDRDQTVHPRNGEQVITAVMGDAPGARVELGVSPQGRHYTRSTHHDDNGNAVAEHWLVHGAGHAWSGGNAEGSYTDAKGPDATRAMLRFFFERPLGLLH